MGPAKPNHTTRRKAMFGAAGALAAASALAGTRSLGSLARAQGLATRTRADLAFNTTVALTVAGPDARALDAALDAGMAALRRVEHATSVYKAHGDLGRLNRSGRLADPDPHLVALLTYAAALSRDTAGRFDCTVQPLWDLWAAHHARGERPSAAALRETVARVDWRGVVLTPSAVRLARPGMAVTLNSINQGYAADVVMAELARHGVEHAFVDTGEFGSRGRHPDGRDWRLGVVAPRDTASLAFTLDPFRRFAATSGDYMTFFSPDFRDHHIFDPRSGTSPPDWSSITVEAGSGLEADGLSTALFTLDAEEGQRLLAARPATVARVFDKTGAEVVGAV